MNNNALKVMLIESCPKLAGRIRAILACEHTMLFTLLWVNEMHKAIEVMNNSHIDIVLLDLSLSNGHSADLVEQILAIMPSAIIILLSTQGDKVFALQALAKGARDCLDKKRLAHNWLMRVIAYNLMLAKADKLMDISEARLQAVGNASSLGIMVSDLYGNITYTNPAYQTITGFSNEQSLGQHWGMAIHASDRLRLEQEWRDELQVQQTFHSDVKITRHDNSTCRVRMTGTFIKDDKGLYGHVRSIENLTDRSSHSSSVPAQLKQKPAWLAATTAQLTIDVMSDAVLSTDCQGRVVYLNQAAQRLTGWQSEDAVGCLLGEVFNLKDRTSGHVLVDSVELALVENQRIQLLRDCILIRKDGVETMIEESASPIHNELGQTVGAVLVFRDVTQSRVMTIKMTHLAQHDSLTGLPNRLLLQERLNQAQRLAKRHDKLLALLYLDIDFFKNINDLYGHEVGDQLLCSIASRMSEAVRDSDTVSRQGGDEFVILLSEIAHPNDAAAFCSKLLKSLAIPHMIEGKVITVGMSIGIGIFPSDGATSQLLMANADNAMFQAKSSGRSCFRFFKEAMYTSAMQKSQFESRIKRALLQHEFILYYQPQIDLVSGEINGAEALIRWQDPDLGLLYPGEFMHIAEQSKLISCIGEWVRWQVCQQQKIWRDEGLNIVPISVNTAASELKQQYFTDNIDVTLKDCGLDAWCLGLELVEKDLTEAAYPIIQQLKKMGLKLVLDDFGSHVGHLNFSQCTAFDSVKIAPDIIHSAVLKSEKASSANAVIELGKNLGQNMVAKGIENQQELAFLRQSQFNGAQGYFIEHPLPAAAFSKLLSQVDPAQLAIN